MRSVAVVFPALMCAMIPMFRQRFNGTVRATVIFSLRTWVRRYIAIPYLQPSLLRDGLAAISLCNRYRELPAIVSESLVGFRHAAHVFLLLHRCAATIGRVEQL